MPLVTEYNAVKDVYEEAAAKGAALPVFCAEDRETLEAILAAAVAVGQEVGIEDVPIIPAWTCRYPARGQMTLLTACGNPILGTDMMFSDLDLFMSENSPYRKLRVLPHLDHAFPWLDGDILEGYADRFASVMCDASEKPFEENIALTANYVEKVRGKVVVEGAVDEIFEAGGDEKNDPTTPEQAADFLRRTGVDVLVPNVGTEHRLMGGQAEYRPDVASAISAEVGKILCLHGTSSVKAEQIAGLPSDGFVKINVYTTLAVHGGQAVAREVTSHLDEIMEKPVLARVANPPRRDAWFAAVRDRCAHFIRALGCERFA